MASRVDGKYSLKKYEKELEDAVRQFEERDINSVREPLLVVLRRVMTRYSASLDDLTTLCLCCVEGDRREVEQGLLNLLRSERGIRCQGYKRGYDPKQVTFSVSRR